MIDSDWFVLKKRIEQLPLDAVSCLRSYEINDPGKIKTGYSGKYRRSEVMIESDLILYIYQEKDGRVHKAYYVCFDDENDRCYQRDVL